MALGTKRSASLFAADAEKRDALKYHDSPQPEVVPVVMDTTPERTLQTDVGTGGRAHGLFFTPEAEGRDFNSVLQEVQEYISESYAALISQGGEEAREQLQRYIKMPERSGKRSDKGAGQMHDAPAQDMVVAESIDYEHYQPRRHAYNIPNQEDAT